jgi:cytochrome oxidase Cu insertion factor (SCO1/SenC/PrrC family)
MLAEAAKLAAGTILADRIAAPEFEKNSLQIGKPVPDIEGEDIDGVKFKLSDYHGKVVVLDFWGFW